MYDGGASDIGYEVSVNGGQNWKQRRAAADDPGRPGQHVRRAARPGQRHGRPRTTQRHDVWLVSTLGLSGNSTVPAVYINRGTVELHRPQRHRLGASRSASTSRSAGDSPDKNWITCDNWPNSKGYGNCYVEWDNNGNGNRELMQHSTDGGLTWIRAADRRT